MSFFVDNTFPASGSFSGLLFVLCVLKSFPDPRLFSLQSNSGFVILGSFLELFSHFYLFFFCSFLFELLSWMSDFTNVSYNFLPRPPFHLSFSSVFLGSILNVIFQLFDYIFHLWDPI